MRPWRVIVAIFLVSTVPGSARVELMLLIVLMVLKGVQVVWLRGVQCFLSRTLQWWLPTTRWSGLFARRRQTLLLAAILHL